MPSEKTTDELDEMPASPYIKKELESNVGRRLVPFNLIPALSQARYCCYARHHSTP